MSNEKVQVNVYLPIELDDYIESLVSRGVAASKSEVLRVVLLYCHKFFEDDNWRNLINQSKLFGENGVRKIC
jgi:Arc/MetJ-type ribon-helix-helix transcriptional regulator